MFNFESLSLRSSESSFAKRTRASSLVPSPLTSSDIPVSRFTLDTGFFNKLPPISTRLSKFSLVETSTLDAFPTNVSSCSSVKHLVMHELPCKWCIECSISSSSSPRSSKSSEMSGSVRLFREQEEP
ncbi:hypothetical protein CKAN_01907500 [Cinnamomum micranthum f. kanehirae]|uniref:Uncharacterized protein n=1 Tax=Cinnamomum micranthum f. kanehirae TaxID=337451 RepID=A0A3S3N0S0_9MAGN|nr:hypothetical protein CKAN_01907500 [Cinnamomum micranthum f. kanehirae]